MAGILIWPASVWCCYVTVDSSGGCLGIRALAGIIGLVGVASQWNLAGNHQFFFVDQHQAETPPLWVHSTKGKSEDITEWEQKAAGGAGWNESVPWGRKEVLWGGQQEHLCLKCKGTAGRMMCIRGRLPSWLTINIDNPMQQSTNFSRHSPMSPPSVCLCDHLQGSLWR